MKRNKSAVADTVPRRVHPRSINYRTHALQVYFCEWSKIDILVRFAGRCVVCGRNTYQRSEDNGATWEDPDPRGVINEEHASASLEARDYGRKGHDVPCCYKCRDSGDKYNIAREIAEGRWSLFK